MAITGAHALLYTAEPQAVRDIFRDVFGFKHVDLGDGWLVFALPPAELGIHPGEGPTYESGVRHQLTLMCDDIATTVEELRAGGVYRIVTPEESIALAEELGDAGSLVFHPLIGGLPPELSWPSLELLAAKVLPAIGKA